MNAAPLARWFETSAGREAAGVRLEVPSVLAEWLRAGAVDVALVSSVEAFRQEGTVIIPGIAIASEHEVLSVRLFSQVPFERVQSVALDTGSLTSVALVQILLKEWYGVAPLYTSLPPDLNRMMSECDAGLLIGDAGMTAKAEGLYVMDLGEAWFQWTGLPFVWAVWLANERADLEQLIPLLHRAKNWGLARLAALAVQEAQRTGLEPELCVRYLTEIIEYDLTPLHMEGLELFRMLLEEA